MACPQGGSHVWETIYTKGGKIITVCMKCGAQK